MSIFTIKILACILMVIDHMRYTIPSFANETTLLLGRMSFPLFAFLITEGYSHTKNLKKYFLRLLIFGIISQIPFMLFRTLLGDKKIMLNVMFTFILGIFSMLAYDKINQKYYSIPICIFIIFIAKIINVDYGWYGTAMVLVFHIFKANKIELIISYFGLVLSYFISNDWLIFKRINIEVFIAYLVPLIFIHLYNGKKGRSIKYFFYLFYPVHLAIFYLINVLLIK